MPRFHYPPSRENQSPDLCSLPSPLPHTGDASPTGGGGEEQPLSPEQQHLKQLIASTLTDKMKELQVGYFMLEIMELKCPFSRIPGH